MRIEGALSILALCKDGALPLLRFSHFRFRFVRRQEVSVGLFVSLVTTLTAWTQMVEAVVVVVAAVVVVAFVVTLRFFSETKISRSSRCRQVEASSLLSLPSDSVRRPVIAIM